MTSASNFKRFGNAALLACMLADLEKGFAAAKTDKEKKALNEIGASLFEGCAWRKAYNQETKTTRICVGSKIFREIQESAERGFKYLTLTEILWEKEIPLLLALLDELNITEFVFSDTSTACMSNLIAFINAGWKVAGPMEQTYCPYCRSDEKRTLPGLRLVKTKKSN